MYFGSALPSLLVSTLLLSCGTLRLRLFLLPMPLMLLKRVGGFAVVKQPSAVCEAVKGQTL